MFSPALHRLLRLVILAQIVLCNPLTTGAPMPYVNIRIAGVLSREQKAKIAEEITDTLERIALKPKSYTYIAFDELPDENWAIAGKLLDEE
jgi:4-oxalocrotonate tautomerase